MELTPFNLGIAMAAGVALAGYVVYILVPAWSAYGRLWERVAASFLSLFILVTLLGFGLSIGFSLVWFYDTYA
jgi:transketolase C-terminal domain/subunit